MNISKSQRIALGTLIIFLGFGVILSHYFLGKKTELFELVNMQYYFSQLEEPEDIVEPVEPEEPVEPVEPDVPEEPVEEKPKEPVVTESYIAILEIPKIDLKKGIYKIGSKYNTVSRNVAILTPSDYPDVVGGNFVLAAHSGTGYLSFFKNLYKLNTGDLAYVTYNNIKYTYKISFIYTQPKVGTINVYRPYGKTTLMLITCTKNDNTTQTVYVAELIETENL